MSSTSFITGVAPRSQRSGVLVEGGTYRSALDGSRNACSARKPRETSVTTTLELSIVADLC
jgi:hypothetical protein